MVVGLIGVVTPHIYYKHVPMRIPPPVITEVTELKQTEPVQKPTQKKKVTSSRVIPVVSPETKTYIDNIFGDKAHIATAVLIHESGLNTQAKGWNCHYYNAEGKRYSASCKTQDREKAWSVDCGIAQINVKGKSCPARLLTLAGNMEEVEKKYKTQGLNAWVSYSSGAYKNFLQM